MLGTACDFLSVFVLFLSLSLPLYLLKCSLAGNNCRQTDLTTTTLVIVKSPGAVPCGALTAMSGVKVILKQGDVMKAKDLQLRSIYDIVQWNYDRFLNRKMCVFAPWRHKEANKRCCGSRRGCWPCTLPVFSIYLFINAEYFILFTSNEHATATRHGLQGTVRIQRVWWRSGRVVKPSRQGCHAPQQKYVRGPIITTSHCKVGLENVYFGETACWRTLQAIYPRFRSCYCVPILSTLLSVEPCLIRVVFSHCAWGAGNERSIPTSLRLGLRDPTFYFYRNLPWQKKIQSFHQYIVLKFKEWTNEALHLEHSFVWCWNLDTSDSRLEIPEKLWNVMLGKDGKHQSGRSCEKWETYCIEWKRIEIFYKQKEGRITGMVTSCVRTAF